MKRKYPLGRSRWRVILCRQTLAVKDSTGERVPSWPDPTSGSDEYWGSLDNLTASEQIAAGIRQTTEALRLRLPRMFPGRAIDRIRDKRTGTLYSITGVAHEDVESVVSIENVMGDPGVLLLQNGLPLVLQGGGFLKLQG